MCLWTHLDTLCPACLHSAFANLRYPAIMNDFCTQHCVVSCGPNTLAWQNSLTHMMHQSWIAAEAVDDICRVPDTCTVNLQQSSAENSNNKHESVASSGAGGAFWFGHEARRFTWVMRCCTTLGSPASTMSGPSCSLSLVNKLRRASIATRITCQ